MSEQETKIKALFDQGVADGLNAAAIQRSLIVDADLTPVQAVSTYNKLAREAGLIMSNDEKKAKQAEILEGADLESEEGVTAAVAEFVETFDIAPSTATAHIKAYAKEKGITLAGAAAPRAPIASREDVVAFLVANRGAERKTLSEGLVELGYKKSTADSLIFMLPFMEEFARQIAE